MSLDIGQSSRRCLVSFATLACLIGVSTLALAQGSAKPAPEKWRPQDGPYVDASENLAERCEDPPDFSLRLRDKAITSNESWSCKVTRFTDTSPGSLRLDLACVDLYERKFKEVMTLRKIDEKSFFVRMTDKGKFNAPEWRANRCPKVAEPSRIESGVREGVYARPGADFDDRCMRLGDVVIKQGEILLSGRTSFCGRTDASIGTQDTVGWQAVCDERNPVGLALRDGRFVPPSPEKTLITKIDDQTLSLQKSRNDEFSEPAQEVKYCPEAAQRAYIESKKK